jgi:hypothetical protein
MFSSMFIVSVDLEKTPSFSMLHGKLYRKNNLLMCHP